MTRHPSDALLTEHARGALQPASAGRVARHLDACGDCRARIARLGSLQTALDGLPRDIQPAHDLWAGIRAAIAPAAAGSQGRPPLAATLEQAATALEQASLRDLATEQRPPNSGSPPVEEAPEAATIEPAVVSSEPAVVPSEPPVFSQPAIGGEPDDAARSGRAPRRSPQVQRRLRPIVRWRPMLAAAVVVLGLGIATLMRGPDGPSGDRPIILPPEAHRLAQWERPYAQASAELEATLERRRDELPLDVAAPLDAALALIDESVRETRAAVAADPSNETLVDMALAAQRRKLELLQRVTQWSSDE